MKIKKEYLVLAVIIVALAVYLATKDRGRVNYELPQLPEVKADAIDRLQIERAGETVTVVKDADRWLIKPGDFPADESAVNRMTDALTGFELTTLVSESKSYPRYDLTDDKALAVSAFKGDNLLRRFDVGKAAASFRHTFVRLPDDHRVYHAVGNFRSDFDHSADALRDKIVLRLAAEGVTAVTFTVGDKRMTVKRAPAEADAAASTGDKTPPPATPAGGQNAPAWLTEDGQPAPAEAAPALDSLLRSLAELRCDTFITDKTAADMGPVAAKIEIQAAEPHVLTLYEKTDQGAAATSSASPYLFRLSAFEVDRMMKPFEALTPKEEPPVPVPEAESKSS